MDGPCIKDNFYGEDLNNWQDQYSDRGLIYFSELSSIQVMKSDLTSDKTVWSMPSEQRTAILRNPFDLCP